MNFLKSQFADSQLNNIHTKQESKMKKTMVVMLGIIIILLIVLSIWGGINFIEIKEKVNSVKTSLTVTQDSIKETIKNIKEAKKVIVSAERIIEQANTDLEYLNDNLKKGLNEIRIDVKLLEEKRKLVDKEIAKIKENIPGKNKILKEPEYHKLGVVK
jgi:biopolymer transport protein ExbB/TolQ